jgi:hypothetical protein
VTHLILPRLGGHFGGYRELAAKDSTRNTCDVDEMYRVSKELVT